VPMISIVLQFAVEHAEQLLFFQSGRQFKLRSTVRQHIDRSL